MNENVMNLQESSAKNHQSMKIHHPHPSNLFFVFFCFVILLLLLLLFVICLQPPTISQILKIIMFWRLFLLYYVLLPAVVSSSSSSSSIVKVYDNVLDEETVTWLHNEAVTTTSLSNKHKKKQQQQQQQTGTGDDDTDICFTFPLDFPSKYSPVEQMLNKILLQLYPNDAGNDEQQPQYFVEYW